MAEMNASTVLHLRSLKLVLMASICVLSLGSLSQRVSAMKTPVYIGGFFPLSPNKASVPGHALLAAAQLALKHVNNTDILRDYELKLIVKDSKCDPAYSANMFMDLMMDQRPTFMVLGGACSDVTELLAELSAYRNLVQVSYASRSLVLSNRDKYPTLFRTLPSESARNMARVKWIKQFGWKNIALLYENTGADLASQSNHQVIDELKKLNRTIVLSEQTTGKQLDLNMKMLARNDARIIVGTFYEKQARHIFCQAYKSGLYGPRYVWLLIGTYSHRWWAVNDPNLQCTFQEMKKAIAYSFIFNNQIFLGDDEQGNARRAISGVTGAEYHKQYVTYLNAMNITKAPNITAYTYDAVWVIAAALNQSLPFVGVDNSLGNISYRGTRMTNILKRVIQNIHFEGITGEVAFFDDGDRYDGMVEILQHDSDGRAVLVGFYYPKQRQLKLVGKGNVWPGGKRPLDRTILLQKFVTIPLWLYAFVCLLSSLGIVLGLVFLAFNVKFRNKRYIKLSSPNLNNVIIVGCIMVYSTIFLYGLDGRVSDRVYTVACRARFSLLSLGFTVAFGAMFSKTWRVHQIFISNVKRVKKVVRDKELFSLLAVIVFIDVFLLILWMSLHPPSRQVILIDGRPRRISLDRDHEIVMCREECRGPHSLPWLVTFYAFHSLLLVFGLFLAFETRKVSVPVLNDSKFIGISVYNVVLLCAIGVPLSHVSSSEPAAGYTLICSVILFCTTVTLSVLFIPKVIQMWKDPDGNPLQGTMLSTRGHHGAREYSTSVTCDHHVSEKHAKLEAEYIKLKQENYQLKGKLCELNKLPNGTRLKRHSIGSLNSTKRHLEPLNLRQKSLRYIFTRKTSTNIPAEPKEHVVPIVAGSPTTDRPSVILSDPKSDDHESELLHRQKDTLEKENLIRDSSSTNYSKSISHKETKPICSHSLPNSDDVQLEASPECDDLNDIDVNGEKIDNGNADCTDNSLAERKSSSPPGQVGQEKKSNGYGLKVYCVQTAC